MADVAASPTESSANSTGRPSSSDNLAATGRSEYSGFGLPFGRPRCDATITVAPRPGACRSVGSEARTRVSSPIVPFLIGTLKSTRRNTRFPARSRSLMLRNPLQPLLDQVAQQIHAPVRITPLVVVPREDLHEVTIH